MIRPTSLLERPSDTNKGKVFINEKQMLLERAIYWESFQKNYREVIIEQW